MHHQVTLNTKYAVIPSPKEKVSALTENFLLFVV